MDLDKNNNNENLQALKAACRTAHLKYQQNFSYKIKYYIKKLIYRFPLFTSKKNKNWILKNQNAIKYKLPKKTFIPSEFIRLEPWEMEYIFNVAMFSKKGIVEIGRKKGGSVLTFGLANNKVEIWSIDNDPEDDNKLKNIIEYFNIKNVNLITGDSQKTSYKEITSYDLLFIDGDHSYQGCLNDLNNWWEKLSIGGHVILHDCYAFTDVQKAVIEFLNDKNIEFIVSPYRGHEHWFNRVSGSLCHFIKK